MDGKLISIDGGKKADGREVVFSLELFYDKDGVLRGGAQVPDTLTGTDFALIYACLSSHRKAILEKFEYRAGQTE